MSNLPDFTPCADCARGCAVEHGCLAYEDNAACPECEHPTICAAFQICAHGPEAPPEPTVTVPYLSPLDRARSAVYREVGIATATVFLVGLGNIVAQLTLDTHMDGRALGLLVVGLAVKAALTGLHKYQRATGEEAV